MIVHYGISYIIIRTWNCETMNCLSIIYQNAEIYTLIFSKDAKFLCTGDSKGGLIIRPTYTLTNFIKLMLFLTSI